MMFVIGDVCDPRTHQRWDLYEPARVPCQKYRLAGKAGHETSVSDPGQEDFVANSCNISHAISRSFLVMPSALITAS